MQYQSMERLAEALRNAKQAAEEAVAADPEDGGTCNFDAPALFLPNWRQKRVEQAAAEAGVGCFKNAAFGRSFYVFPLRVGGQGDSRTRAAEAAKENLAAAGWRASVYYAMD